MALTLSILSYLLGSIPTGYLLGLYSGVDVRRTGSGNIGATNVARTVGKGIGLLTLAADAAKGWIPVYVAMQLGFGESLSAVAGGAAFLGHLYPVFLRFNGGKGVATAMGVLIAMTPLAVAALAGVFLVALVAARMVSLGSISAAVAAPIMAWLLGYPSVHIGLAAFLGAMVILRHRSNIQRVLAGTEPRLGAG